MYITQEADYAMRIVYCLAQSGVRQHARSISEQTDVSLRFSLKILGKLSAAGIVSSYKGSRGGYELARKPGEISLRDVLGAVEGPFVMSRCLSDEKGCHCGLHNACCFQRTFGRISASINSQLQAVTFQDVLAEGTL